MKQLAFYKETLNCTDDDQVFRYLLNTLKPSNTLWSYFVNWEKVLENTRKIEIALNSLNYLIGKRDFDVEFKHLVRSNPEVVEVIPALVVRDGDNAKKFNILVDFKQTKLVYEDYNFDKPNPDDRDIEKYLTFMEKTGIKEDRKSVV